MLITKCQLPNRGMNSIYTEILFDDNIKNVNKNNNLKI
jgi:hypothetical protein